VSGRNEWIGMAEIYDVRTMIMISRGDSGGGGQS
jgi:hypothetical protein